MTKNPVLAKKAASKVAAKGAIPLPSTVMKSVRFPTGIAGQLEAMAAEQGLDFTAVVLNAIERGLIRDSITGLVTRATETMDTVRYDRDLMSQVLGDMADKLDRVEKLLKK